jgi:hypothetical protein
MGLTIVVARRSTYASPNTLLPKQFKAIEGSTNKYNDFDFVQDYVPEHNFRQGR